ncbi:MAG: hypothetical protein JSR78_16180 [Proteobacteria bacterium]|nr:hypothetical protein [Pseudomonadota bacterium]
MQAAKFWQILRETVALPGHYMIVSDLETSYREIAAREGWPVLRWAEIGREMAGITKRKRVKLQGKKHVAYLLR